MKKHYLYSQVLEDGYGKPYYTVDDSYFYEEHQHMIINMLLAGATFVALDTLCLAEYGEIKTLDFCEKENVSNDFEFEIYRLDTLENHYITKDTNEALAMCVDGYMVDISTKEDGYLATI